MLSELVVLGLASGLLSTTLTQGEIFETPRGWVEKRSAWWGKLVSCSFCMGHWTAAALVAASAAVHGTKISITIWLAVTAISAITSGLIARLYGD